MRKTLGTPTVAAASTAAAPPTERRSARERLLSAADELFYEGGIHTVGIEKVIERAGVAKASLYDCFGSKDALIRAYLEARHDARKARIAARIDHLEAPRERLLGVFDAMGDYMSQTNFSGCAFNRAAAESKPGSTARMACGDAREWMRELFVSIAKDANLADAKVLGGQWLLLYDGAAVSAQLGAGGEAARSAKAMAAMLFDAAAPKKKTRSAVAA